jgi:CheY-like chemotaxis protein
LEARHVLVVGNDRAAQTAIRTALSEDGIGCEIAESPEQARKLADDPAVGAVLLDVALPERAGLDVLRLLRERRPALRVIALGTAAAQDRILEALRRGASDYLAKPIHEEELRLAVRRAIDATETATRFDDLSSRLLRLADGLAGFAAATGSEPPEAFADDVVDTAADLLGAGRTSLLLPDGEGGLRVAAIRGGDHLASELGPVPIDDSVAGLALAGEDGLLIDDVDRDERCAGRARRGRYASRSALLVPLRDASGALGVLCATERPGTPFGEEDLALARLLAWAATPRLAAPAPPPEAVAEESEGESAADEALRVDVARGVAAALVDEIEPGPLLHAALRPVAERLGAAPVSLYLVDARTGSLALEACIPGARSDRPRLPRDRGLAGTVLSTGRLVASARPDSEPGFAADVDTPEDGAESPLYCVPIRIRGRVLGLARVFLTPESTPAARTAELLCTALSAAVRNALLYRSLLESIDDLARARREANERKG